MVFSIKNPSPHRGRAFTLFSYGPGHFSDHLLDGPLHGRFFGRVFTVGFGRSDTCADLFVHIKLHIIISTTVLAAGAGSLPSAEGLEARPRAGRRALRTVGIRHAGLDVIEEPFGFLAGAIEASREAIIHIVGNLHGFLKVADLANGGDG